MPERHGSVGRRSFALRALLTERIGLKLASLLVAVLLWLVVRAQQPSEGYIDVAVIPALDSSLVLVGDPPTVRVLIAGRTADLVRLYETPPVIHRTVRGNAQDTIVLELATADVHIPVEMVDAVRVLDVQPRHVVLHIATRAP